MNDSLNVGVSKSCRMRLSSIFFLSANQGNYFLKRNFSGSSEQGRYCNDDDIAFVCRFQIFLKRKSLEFSLRFVIFSSTQHVHGYGIVRDFKSDSPLRISFQKIKNSFSISTNLLTVICWRWFVMWSSDDDKNMFTKSQVINIYSTVRTPWHSSDGFPKSEISFFSPIHSGKKGCDCVTALEREI